MKEDYYNYEGPVAAIDILGYGELLKNYGIKYIKENIVDQLQIAETTARYFTNREIRLSTGNLSDPMSGAYNILPILFSDTIIAITTGETTLNKKLADLSMASMCRFCEIMMQKAFEKNIALRGAISYGKCYISIEPLYYIGKPIYEIFKLEKEQEWAGITIADNAKKYLGKTHRHTEYEVPFKKERKKMKVINWTFSPDKPDFDKCFNSKDEEVLDKKENTIEFYEKMGSYKHFVEEDEETKARRKKEVEKAMKEIEKIYNIKYE